jgi:hypothetical protein
MTKRTVAKMYMTVVMKRKTEPKKTKTRTKMRTVCNMK